MAAVLYAVIFAACARAAIEMSQRKPKHGRLGAVYNCGDKNLPLLLRDYRIKPKSGQLASVKSGVRSRHAGGAWLAHERSFPCMV